MTSGGTGAGEAPVIYSSDLIGSAAGFIIFSGLLVPLLGIRNAILLLPVLVLAAFLTAPSAKREGN